MAKRPDPAGDMAALQEEVAALRRRLDRLEEFVGLRKRGAKPRPRMDEDMAPPESETRIEPVEPWNLGGPGKGSREP
jgi:hypothetical protein